jgi:ribonuclease P protein component
LDGVKASLPRRCRLGKPDFVVVLRTGKMLRGRGIAVLVKPNRLRYSRLGMVVPKRVLKRSVDRNRYKRTFREWFRHRQANLAGRDWIVRMNEIPEGGEAAFLLELERLVPPRA